MTNSRQAVAKPQRSKISPQACAGEAAWFGKIRETHVLRFLLVAATIVVVIVVAILAYASTRPDTFRVARSAHMDAPPEEIYPLIVNFRAWTAWSPYEMRDPDMKRTYSGADEGVGAAYAWDGNKDIGSGNMKIVEADKPSRIVIDLIFTAPMKANNTAIFTLVPQEGGTLVTWAMEGEANLMAKLVQLFMDMDKMIGTDFEAGLAKLKSQAEAK